MKNVGFKSSIDLKGLYISLKSYHDILDTLVNQETVKKILYNNLHLIDFFLHPIVGINIADFNII